jgi:hypothetical protein
MTEGAATGLPLRYKPRDPPGINQPVAARVPKQQRVLAAKRLDLSPPHFRGGGIALRKQNHGTRAVPLIIDMDAATI